MNKNYSYRTTIYKSILTQIYVFLVLFTIFDFYHENFISKNCKKILFYQKFVHFGANTSIYCSRIIVVRVHANVFSKVYPACHNIANGIKPGSNLKATDKHAVDRAKAVCWGVRCINCSHNNMAKGICLLDKKAIFVYTGKKIIQVRAFERNIPLTETPFSTLTEQTQIRQLL